MLSSSPPPHFWRLALVLLVSLSLVVNPALAFHNETLNAAQFSSNFRAPGTFMCADGITYSIQSTTTIGATISADFQGTAVYLLSLVDAIDRGQYDIAVDGGTPTSVSGDGLVRDCAVIYAKTGLAYGPHSISLTNARASTRNNTWTKFEFLALFATVPDEADLTTSPPTQTTPPASNTGTSNNSNGGNNGTSNSGLSAGAIAGIAIGAVAAISIIVVLLVIYFHRQRNAHRYSNTPSYSGPGNGGGTGDITPFPMSSATPAPFQSYPSGNVVTAPMGSGYGAQSIHDMQSIHSVGAPAWAGANTQPPLPQRGQLSEEDVDRIARRMAEVANTQGRVPPPGPVFQQMSNPHLRQMQDDQRSTTTGSAVSPPPEPARTTQYPREKVPMTPAPNYNAPYQGTALG